MKQGQRKEKNSNRGLGFYVAFFLVSLCLFLLIFSPVFISQIFSMDLHVITYYFSIPMIVFLIFLFFKKLRVYGIAFFSFFILIASVPNLFFEGFNWFLLILALIGAYFYVKNVNEISLRILKRYTKKKKKKQKKRRRNKK